MIQLTLVARCSLCPWTGSFKNRLAVPEVCPKCGNNMDTGRISWKQKHKSDYSKHRYGAGYR